MTSAIFFDLETSDLSPIGQILNFSFYEVSRELEVISTFSGLIRVSRLQLPRPHAIAANRVDLIEHQKQAELSEHDFAVMLDEQFKEIARKYGDYKVSLVGFNSSDFDINYLRTTLIRNGITPYYRFALRDLYQVSQFLWIASDEFRTTMQHHAIEGKVSLKLEAIARAHGLLEGDQAHESEADVKLSIELARLYRRKYHLDPLAFDCYQARDSHRTRKPVILRGFHSREHVIERRSELMTLLDANHRSSLWINLNEWKKCEAELALQPKPAIKWFACDRKMLFLDSAPPPTQEELQLAEKALNACSSFNLTNFFDATHCDIEANIYRVSPGSIQKLGEALHQKKVPANFDQDLKTLQLRFRLGNYVRGSGGDEAAFESALRDYALYRYGGRLQLARRELEREEERAESDFHPTLAQLLKEMDEVKASAAEQPWKIHLMDQLKKFYMDSEIVRIAGDALLPGV